MKPAMRFDLILPSRIIFGEGSIKRIGEEAERLGAKRALIVTSQGMLKREPLKQLTQSLQDHQLSFGIFSGVEPEPTIETVHRCSTSASEQDDLIVGLGGGSVMDVAKKAAADLGLRKIMVPTTAGTGSEVTHESVLRVEGKKRAFVDTELTADAAVIDPEVSMSMPPQLAAATGLDALAHSVECYESRKSNPLVKTLALEAFELLKTNITKAVAGDKEARENMSLGSLLAGMAFGNSGTTLGHALSYPLSNRGVPHGEAVAVVLPYALEFNNADPALIAEVRQVIQLIKLQWNTNWNIQEMANEVMQDERHLANNPRRAAHSDVLEIFKRLEGSLTTQ